MAKLLIILLFWIGQVYADPWGKDADLAWPITGKESLAEPIATPLLGSIGENLIWFHQNIISPCDGPRSHYFPSSSQYTLDAMRRYGFFQGFIMGCDRLMRENSEEWVYRKHPSGLKSDPIK